ncbi:MAG: radical SAM family heme chaperone HemW [Parabacteroides sp.]|nr:radical SAM family heme chaperone HemW [Parabacteroides sp.]
MAGLYIHVPFCTKRCLYCDFFSNTEMRYKEAYVEAIGNEMALRKTYIRNETLETIYFGGGTPSQLGEEDFHKIFKAIYHHFNVSDQAEITLEANPDDMNPEYISMLRKFPFNRISMGVQSFHPEDLRFLNRRHDREQAIRAVELCKQYGITNISIDLIYGLPNQTRQAWEENLDMAIRLDVPHLSAYHLIYEEGTALYKLKEAGKVRPIDEELSVSFFSTLIDRLVEAGYQHYEISNFARPGFLSRHNSSYWTGEKYLGLGPSAHSYNGIDREWNVSSLPIYIKGIENGLPAIESENLDLYTRYNDFIITGLRTMWGISFTDIQTKFGEKLLSYCLKQARPHINQGLLLQTNDKLILSKDGIFVSDGIMSDLLWV